MIRFAINKQTRNPSFWRSVQKVVDRSCRNEMVNWVFHPVPQRWLTPWEFTSSNETQKKIQEEFGDYSDQNVDEKLNNVYLPDAVVTVPPELIPYIAFFPTGNQGIRVLHSTSSRPKRGYKGDLKHTQAMFVLDGGSPLLKPFPNNDQDCRKETGFDCEQFDILSWISGVRIGTPYALSSYQSLNQKSNREKDLLAFWLAYGHFPASEMLVSRFFFSPDRVSRWGLPNRQMLEVSNYLLEYCQSWVIEQGLFYSQSTLSLDAELPVDGSPPKKGAKNAGRREWVPSAVEAYREYKDFFLIP